MYENNQAQLKVSRHFDLYTTTSSIYLSLSPATPKWKDIADALFPSHSSNYLHDIILRIFHHKMKKILGILTNGNLFGIVKFFWVLWSGVTKSELIACLHIVVTEHTILDDGPNYLFHNI